MPLFITPSHIPIVCPPINYYEPFILTHSDVCTYSDVTHRRHVYVKIMIAYQAKVAYACSSVVVESMIVH